MIGNLFEMDKNFFPRHLSALYVHKRVVISAVWVAW